MTTHQKQPRWIAIEAVEDALGYCSAAGSDLVTAQLHDIQAGEHLRAVATLIRDVLAGGDRTQLEKALRHLRAAERSDSAEDALVESGRRYVADAMRSQAMALDALQAMRPALRLAA